MFDLERQRRFDSVNLQYGNHSTPEDGLCAMEMVAYLAGEQHGDHPDCVCPVLTGYTIRLNDAMPEHWRQQLKPYLPLLIGTRDGHEVGRAELLAWRAIRVFLPILLEACRMPEKAAKMRDFQRGLDAAADAAYTVYASAGSSPAGSRAINATRAAAMHAARAAYAAHCAGAARSPHMGRAMDASDAVDAAIAATRVVDPETVWPLALEALDDALAIGAAERTAAVAARPSFVDAER